MSTVAVRTLDGTRITNQGLEKLTGLISLQQLKLSDTSTGDRGLKHLQLLPSIRHLWLDHTQVSDAAAPELQKALLSCIIERKSRP